MSCFKIYLVSGADSGRSPVLSLFPTRFGRQSRKERERERERESACVSKREREKDIKLCD